MCNLLRYFLNLSTSLFIQNRPKKKKKLNLYKNQPQLNMTFSFNFNLNLPTFPEQFFIKFPFQLSSSQIRNLNKASQNNLIKIKVRGQSAQWLNKTAKNPPKK
uniref:Uncharacterized protein n=1 Tax=Rhizophora mucronata TaxID=61149 RepID=A0A2P2IKE3_RHIMU